MVQFFVTRLEQMASEPSALALALLLGVVSALASACCTLPAMAVLVGYSGSRTNSDRQQLVRSALWFTLGVILSLMILGGLAGWVGQAAQAGLGRSWKAVAGVVAVVLGLATLNLLPFSLSLPRFDLERRAAGLAPALAGLVLGGMVAVSSLPCNPGIFIVVGAALLQGRIVWAMLLLGCFAVGFSLPLGALLFGISLSRFTLAARGLDQGLRWIFGVLLLGAGLYLLLTS